MTDTDMIYEEEYTFPDLTPTAQCKAAMAKVKRKQIKHGMLGGIAYAICMACFAMTLVFGTRIHDYDSAIGDTVTNTGYMAGTIICGILLGASLIFALINVVKAIKDIRTRAIYQLSIQINSKYSAFIKQGYTAKEAYQLTSECMQIMISEIAAYKATLSARDTIVNNPNQK